MSEKYETELMKIKNVILQVREDGVYNLPTMEGLDHLAIHVVYLIEALQEELDGLRGGR